MAFERMNFDADDIKPGMMVMLPPGMSIADPTPYSVRMARSLVDDLKDRDRSTTEGELYDAAAKHVAEWLSNPAPLFCLQEAGE